MAAPYFGMVEKVHVMLIDDDKEFVPKMIDLLKLYNYKVMMVDTTSAAMSMLLKEKKKIDVMILNVHSSDMLSFQLLAQAEALHIISLAVCNGDDELAPKKALEEGAYLCLKEPFDKEIIKYIWQFVLKEKIQNKKVREGSEKHSNKVNVNGIGEHKLRRKRGRRSMTEINEDESRSNEFKQKVYIEWTDDLHAKFMKAVHQLGDGKCYPKEILELMNMPGLTRMQVASHLQKCRRNNWRSPKERKSIHQPCVQESSSGSHESRSSFRKFGTMPRLQTNAPNLQCNPYQTQRGPEFPFSLLAQGESSIQQLYPPQLHVQPNYFSICNPFNNPFSSAQTHQQQHAPYFEIHDPLTTNYMPCLALNSGDHHTLSDYNLDLNVSQGATYSGSGLMSDVDIGNATINDYNMNVNPGFDQICSDDQEAEITNYFDKSLP